MTLPINPHIALLGAPGKPVVTVAEVDDAPPVRFVTFPEVPGLGQMSVACDGTPMESVLAIANPPAPKPWVPSQVPAWALSSILDQRGKLAALELAIQALTEPTKSRVRWLFQRGDMFDRDGDVVNGLGAAIGYSPAQVDQLFVDAYNYAQA